MKIDLNSRIILTLLVIIFAAALLVSGCNPNPMTSYIGELEKKQAEEALENLTEDLFELDKYLNAIFEIDIENLTHEDLIPARNKLTEIENKLADLKVKVDEIDLGSDEKVREANGYFMDAIFYTNKLLGEMHLLIDSVAEVIDLFSDLKTRQITASAFLSELERIEEITNSITARGDEYIEKLNQSTDNWQAVVDEALAK